MTDKVLPPVRIGEMTVPHETIDEHAHTVLHTGTPNERGLATTILALLDERAGQAS